MDARKLADYNDYDGVDADLETSLFEYGLIWKKGLPGHEDDYHFIYGVAVSDPDGECNYNLFDWGDYPVDMDAESEWDWAELDKVAECAGMELTDWLAMPTPHKVHDMILYYGHENVFGSSYHPFQIAK